MNKGLYFNESHLTPDQSFVLHQCNHRIADHRRSFFILWLVFVSGFFPPMFGLFGGKIGSFEFNAPYLLFIGIFIFLIPSRGKSGRLEYPGKFYRVISSKYFHRRLYAEIKRSRLLLEDAGINLEESDWDRRCRQAFEECRLFLGAEYDFFKADDLKHYDSLEEQTQA